MYNSYSYNKVCHHKKHVKKEEIVKPLMFWNVFDNVKRVYETRKVLKSRLDLLKSFDSSLASEGNGFVKI